MCFHYSGFFELEWDTVLSFNSQIGGRPLSYDDSTGSSPLVSYISGTPSRYFITSLNVGVSYYIWARSKNSLGFGPFTFFKVAVPLTSSDPPAVPVRIEQLPSSHPESSRAIQGHSLLVSWSAPVVSPKHLDLWGNGGSPVTSYLVEWSASSFEEFNPPIQLISTSCGGGTGLVRVTPPNELIPTAWLSLDADAEALKTAVENLPQVRTVETSDISSGSWRVTFISELEQIVNPLNVQVICTDGSIPVVSDATIESQGTALPLGYENLEVSSESTSLVISDLIPGVAYYARVSATTMLGCGRSRLAQSFGDEETTPSGGMTVPIFPPDPPVSFWHSEGIPTLSRESSNSLRVTMGAPEYDGGDGLDSFEIEFDTTPFFTTSHFVSVSATQPICDSCVVSFTYSTSTLLMSGTDWDGTFFGTIDIGNRILVDGTHVFTIADFSATSSLAAIIVEPTGHNALTDIVYMGGADISIYGASYVVSGLEEGVMQYVRVYARNNEAGAGNPTLPHPPAVAPIGPPPPPAWVNVSISDAQDKLGIIFPYVSGASGHLIEVFKSGVENAGVRKVQSVTTSGNPTSDNSFTLSFGPIDVPAMGTYDNASVSAEEGQSTLTVAGGLDLTHVLRRGDPLNVSGSVYLVHSLGTFDALTIPLADSSGASPSTPQLLGISDLSGGYTGSTISGLLPLRMHTTQPVSAVATAAEMEEALEALPSISDVTVAREETGDGFVWYITFEGSHVGDVDLLGLNGRKIGIGSSVEVAEVVAGVSPNDYQSFNVLSLSTSPSSTNDGGSSSVETINYSVGGLETGVNYTVRVSSAANEVGFGYATESHRPVSPKGIPGIVSEVALTVVDEKTLHLIWDQSESDNGSPVSSYIVEWDMSNAFSDPVRMEVSPVAHIQAARTDAWERGWLSEAYFTLSLLSFKGSFRSNSLGGNAATYVSVSNGNNSLSLLGNGLWNDVGADLGVIIRRGELFRVAGQEFSACLSLDEAHDEAHDTSTVSLCDSRDARVPATFIITSDSFFYDDDTFDHVPVFKLDTAVGQVVNPLVSGSSLAVDSEISDLNDVLSLGDHLRIGRPDTGCTVRICETSSSALTATTIDICEEVDATKIAYLEAVDLYGVSTLQVQELEFVVDSSTPGFDADTSYRLTIGSDVAQDCILIGAESSELETFIIDSFDVVDDIDVSLTTTLDTATITTYTYSVTFVGNNVPGAANIVEPIDIGLNGCQGSPFGISSSTNAISPSTVPLYKVQTSPNIAWDASSEDVRAAVKSLSGVCDVSVERSVRGGGFEWLITFDKSHEQMLTAMKPNGYRLDHDLAYVDPDINLVAIGSLDLPVNASGVPHFARIAAVNEVGIGPAVSPTPTFASASTQPPGPPKEVILTPYDGLRQLLLQWDPPDQDGRNVDVEDAISDYLVEWDTSQAFDSSTERRSQRISSTEIGSLLDVQSIILSVSADHYLAGTWSLSVDGQTTSELPHDATAEQVTQALESLCTVGSVNVWRTVVNGPPHYLVTFVDMPHSGSQTVPANGPEIEMNSGHCLSLNDEHLYACESSDLTTSCSPSGATTAIGSRPEVQRLVCTPSDAYPFSVSFSGGGGNPSLYPFSPIASDATANEIEMSLRVFLGKVSVSIDGGVPGTGVLSCEGSGSYMDVMFLDFIGGAPMMTSSELATPIMEVTKGVSQTVRGRKPYSIVLDVLTDPSLPVYMRVTGYSPSGGYGTSVVVSTYVSDAVVYPTPPLNVAVQLDTSSSSSNKEAVRVSWLHKDGFDDLSSVIDGYRIEWDATSTFSSSCGDGAEVQTLTAMSNAVPAGETFSLTVGIGGDTILSCVAWDVSATTVHNAFVAAGYTGTTVTRSGDGSLSWGYDYRWHITFESSVSVDVSPLQAESCGTGSDIVTWSVKTEHEGRPNGDCVATSRVPFGFTHLSFLEASTTNGDTFETHITNVPLGVDIHMRVASMAYLSSGEILLSDWAYSALPPVLLCSRTAMFLFQGSPNEYH